MAAAVANTPLPALDLNFDINTSAVRLLVKHNGEVIEGKVSSDALCLASPVWKKFLFPPWEVAEELVHSVKQIDCTEDDSVALSILLNIAHLKFGKVPDRLNNETLFNVARLCDQYDCVALVRPWAVENLWLQAEINEITKSIGNDDCYRWLLIAWVFGRGKTFRYVATYLVTKTSVDESQTWRSITPFLPPGILESIQASRRTAIEEMLEATYRVLDRYDRIWHLAGSQSRATVCSDSEVEDRPRCDALVYGSFILGLRLYNLYPQKSPEHIIISAEALGRQLLSINIQSLDTWNHTECGRKGYDNSIEAMLTKTRWDPVNESHILHMRSQRERLGGP